MKTSCIVFAAIATLALPAWSQDAKAFVGRWDLTLTSPRGGTWPQWMEVEQKGDALSGRIQPRGGAVRPIVGAKVEGGHLLINVTAAGRGPAVDWDLTVEGGKLAAYRSRVTIPIPRSPACALPN